MQQYIIQKFQSKIAKKVKRYLKAKSEIWRMEKSLTLEFVHSPCFTQGMVIIRDRSVLEQNLSPFQLLIGGDSSWLTPFRIVINHHVLKNHFAKLVNLGFVPGDKAVEKYRQFLSSMKELDSMIRELNPLYDFILFSHFADILMAQIETLNSGIFQELGVKCSLFLTETLKLKYQQKNFRYSKGYLIQSRNFDRIKEFQQILSPGAHDSKIHKQFKLIFIPKFGSDLSSLQHSFLPLEAQTSIIQDPALTQRNQGLVFKDLNQDKKLFKKFIRPKKSQLLGNFYSYMQNQFIKNFMQNKLSKLNKFERGIFGIILVTLFCVD